VPDVKLSATSAPIADLNAAAVVDASTPREKLVRVVRAVAELDVKYGSWSAANVVKLKAERLADSGCLVASPDVRLDATVAELSTSRVALAAVASASSSSVRENTVISVVATVEVPVKYGSLLVLGVRVASVVSVALSGCLVASPAARAALTSVELSTPSTNLAATASVEEIKLRPKAVRVVIPIAVVPVKYGSPFVTAVTPDKDVKLTEACCAEIVSLTELASVSSRIVLAKGDKVVVDAEFVPVKYGSWFAPGVREPSAVEAIE
jgi:hypothetical protein